MENKDIEDLLLKVKLTPSSKLKENILQDVYKIKITENKFQLRNTAFKKIAFALITILGAQEFFINTYRNFCGSNLSFHDLWISLIILVICVLIHQIIEKYLPFVLGKSKKVK